MRRSRRVAWWAVRGKPSRIKDAEGEVEVEVESWGGLELEESEAREDETRDSIGVVVESQFLERSSARMRLRIVASGTRSPAFMTDSALRPAYTC